MTPGRVLIHGSLACLSIRITLLHELLNLGNSLYNARGQVLYVHTFVLVLLEVKFVVDIFG